MKFRNNKKIWLPDMKNLQLSDAAKEVSETRKCLIVKKSVVKGNMMAKRNQISQHCPSLNQSKFCII